MASSKVLLTGASGFLGSRIADELGSACVPVHRGPSAGVQWDLSQGLKDLHGVDFDAVCHAAAHIPGQGKADYAPNVRMTEHLLQSLDRRLSVFCFISTLDVYGPPAGVLTEGSPLAPSTPYAESKLRCEELVRAYAASTGTPLLVLRMTHLYGPGERPLKFIPKAIAAAVDGRPITVYGDGADLRDYLYVDDAAHAVAGVLGKPVAGTYNVASGTSVSIRDVAERIASMTGGRIEYLPREKPRVDYRFDTRALQQTTGFVPRVPLEEGLRRQIEWYRARGGA
jgi:nucleoside-diphosphate-sugar epimerase